MKLFWIFSAVLAMALGAVEMTQAQEKTMEEYIQLATTPKDKLDLDWWKARHESKIQDRKSRPIDIVFIGDSITHGWEVEFGAAGYGLAIPEEYQRFFREGAGYRVFKEFWADRNVLNLGYGGDETQNLLWRLDNGEVDDIDAKLVMLMIGTNNIGVSQCPAEATAAGIKAVLDKIHEKLPKAKIVLVSIPPLRAKEGWERQTVVESNKLAQQLVDNENVFYIDLYHKFVDGNDDIIQAYIPEGVHPNADGYRIWTKELQPYYERFVLQNDSALPQ